MKSDAIVGALKSAAKADIDVDDALDQLSELVELAHAKPRSMPDVMLSLVPVGPDTDSTVAVGWDTCAGCKLAVSKCSCKNGPVEPDYVKKFRQEKPDFRVPTPVSSKGVKGHHAQIESVDPDNITPGAALVAATEKLVTTIANAPDPACSTCGMATPADEGDLNDDGTFTCHGCQEATCQEASA